MSSMGFGQNACQWVSIMLHNTSATATFNGWRSASFPERSGVQQGSPLSPLLYVIAAQPLASHLRRQSQLGIIRPITMPDGQPAPVSHQHADDTSLHVLQPRDAQVAIDTSIDLFCAASCSQLNANKSQAFLVQSQPLASASVSALPSISFITGQQTVKHLGVRLGYDMSAACHQTFTGIHQAIKAKARHWSARGLSFLGRVHVAKQVLAASLWYHATFQQPPRQLLQQISRQLSQYVASALAASTPDGHCASDALLQTWHRLRLAVLHSIWTAARITASSTQGLAPTQASPSPSHSHLASRLALKTITSMIRHDWVKCNDDVRQISGVCSSWLRGRDPSMTLEAFQHLWCHNHTLASIHTVQTSTEERLELKVHLSDSSPVPLF